MVLDTTLGVLIFRRLLRPVFPDSIELKWSCPAFLCFNLLDLVTVIRLEVAL